MMPQNVGPGENRFNSSVYKSSHNSYNKDQSLASQIDDYNIWQIELDIYDYEGSFKVNHNCDPASLNEASELFFLLIKMVNESTTYFNRFTVIYLDLKGNGGDGCLYSWGSSMNERLKTTFISSLNHEHIYPSSEFIGRDGSAWPSWQELVRRGYYWCVIVDWHGMRPANALNDPFFFEGTSANLPDPQDTPDNMVLVSVDGGCDASPSGETPKLSNERWLYRIYPGGACAGDCLQHNGNYWQFAVFHRFNFVASNCVDWDHTFQSPIHSPNPLYVNSTAPISCPRNYSSCQWGTHSFPFQNLTDAIHQASPSVTLFITGGEYQVRVSQRSTYRIHQPIILRAVNGTVRIK